MSERAAIGWAATAIVVGVVLAPIDAAAQSCKRKCDEGEERDALGCCHETDASREKRTQREAAARAVKSQPARPPFDRSAAAAELRRVAEDVNTCRRPNGPLGDGYVIIAFRGNGTVEQVEVVRPPYQGTSVGACVAAKFKLARIPAFDGFVPAVGKSFTIEPAPSASANTLQANKLPPPVPRQGAVEDTPSTDRVAAVQPTPGGQWSAVYQNPVFGELHLVENNGVVRGKWQRADKSAWGELSGKPEGNVLHFAWVETRYGVVASDATRKGKGIFVFERDEKFPYLRGQYGIGEDEVGSRWDNIRLNNRVPNPESIPTTGPNANSASIWD